MLSRLSICILSFLLVATACGSTDTFRSGGDGAKTKVTVKLGQDGELKSITAFAKSESDEDGKEEQDDFLLGMGAAPPIVALVLAGGVAYLLIDRFRK